MSGEPANVVPVGQTGWQEMRVPDGLNDRAEVRDEMGAEQLRGIAAKPDGLLTITHNRLGLRCTVADELASR